MSFSKQTMLNVFAALIMLAAISFAGTYSGGSGTSEEPYLISTYDDIMELRATPGDFNKNFKQTADIDLSPQLFYGAVIAPDTDQSTDGFQGTSFTGVYDGMHFNITNYNVYTVFGNTTYVGLFGYNNGTIQNVRVNGDIDLYQGTIVGLLCGYNTNTITDCEARGIVSCSTGSGSVGGLVGYNSNATIFNSFTNVSLICGDNSEKIGGIVGDNYVYQATGRLSDCYSFADISVGDSSRYIGVLCGYVYTYSGSSWYRAYSYVDKCYGVGDIQEGDSCTGVDPFIGSSYNGGYSTTSITNTFWNTELCSLESSANAIGLTDAQMRIQNVFMAYGFDFVGETVNGTKDIWTMPAGDYPRFVWETPGPGLTSIAISGPDTLAEEGTANYTCTAYYSDGSSADVTNSADWSTSDSDVATIDSTGLLTSYDIPLSESITVSAEYNGYTDNKSVYIEAIELVSIIISGPSSVNENAVAGYTCTANYSDSSTVDITELVQWSTSDTSMAEISSEGLLTTLDVVEPQTIYITADFGNVSDQFTITIEPVIPDVTGMLLQNAKIKLNQNALTVGDVSFEYSYDAARFTVIDQSPAAGYGVENTIAVDLAVSLGMECQEYYMADINGDCIVNLNDFSIMAADWLADGSLEDVE